MNIFYMGTYIKVYYSDYVLILDCFYSGLANSGLIKKKTDDIHKRSFIKYFDFLKLTCNVRIKKTKHRD